jgi:hypothetical protein
MYPALIAASLDNGRDPRILLNPCGAAVALALSPNATSNRGASTEPAPGNAAKNL